MRFEKADNLLQLALEMQASRAGLALMDIQERFGVSRRTAMRMRDALLRNFPQAEEIVGDDRVKRWRLPAGVLDRLVAFTPEELADLEAGIRLLRGANRGDQADNLAGLKAKLTALMRPEALRRVEPDLEALLEAEGLAMRPGPRPRMRILVVEELRDALKKGCKVKLLYRNRRNRHRKERLVHPYGFLHGHRNYLVGFHEHPKADKVVLFSLPYIEEVTVLDDQPFSRDPDFSLRDFAAQSFGVFQEQPFDVVWRFTPQAAPDAREFVFHPEQETEERPDGSLIVRFRAGGDLEMAWHLYMWGDQVEVLEPPHLAALVAGHRRAWPALP